MHWVQHYWDPNPPAGVTHQREQVMPLRLIGAKVTGGAILISCPAVGAYCRIATAVSIASVKNFLGLLMRLWRWSRWWAWSNTLHTPHSIARSSKMCKSRAFPREIVPSCVWNKVLRPFKIHRNTVATHEFAKVCGDGLTVKDVEARLGHRFHCVPLLLPR
jgi:hypothetical protein